MTDHEYFSEQIHHGDPMIAAINKAIETLGGGEVAPQISGGNFDFRIEAHTGRLLGELPACMEGMAAVYPGILWKRDDERQGTTIYATTVPPKLIPGWDGEKWVGYELWVVEVPPDTYVEHTILDKPHRVTWVLEWEPDRDDSGESYDDSGFLQSRILYRGPAPSGLGEAYEDPSPRG
jgi:hypothetical protein